MVTINFEAKKNGYVLKDAIVLPEDHGLTDNEIALIKKKRFDDWYTIVTVPPLEDQIVENELQNEVTE